MSRKTNGNMATILGRRVDFFDQAGSRHVVKVHFEKSFKVFLDDNRNIDKRHKGVIISIQRYGQLLPIVVNESLEVIEGQHRLEACRELEFLLPILSVLSHLKKVDVAVMNNSQKARKNEDFLKYQSKGPHGNCAYVQKNQKFLKDYPLPFAIGILLLAGKNPDPNIGNSRGPMPSFRDGTFRILDYETAEIKAAQLVKMKSFIPQLIRISKFFKRCSWKYQPLKKFSYHYLLCPNEKI